MGGIRCGNVIVKSNMIFRSPCLTELTDEDKRILDELKLDYIIDFRSEGERSADPDYIPEGTTYLHLPASQSKGKLVVQPHAVADYVPSWLPASLCIKAFRWRFKRLYKKFPFNNSAYRKMFQLMDEGKVFLFHCTAGKDRTGVAAMLVLLALGADFDTIMQDYLLSNVLREKANEEYVKKFQKYPHFEKLKAIFKVALGVSPDLLQISYNAIIKKYGTVQEYFLKEYGADEQHIAVWRKTYTCPAKEQND